MKIKNKITKINKAMKTTVTNLITREKWDFVNDLTLTDNIINAIICKSNATSQLLSEDYRKKIRTETEIKEDTSKLTGRKFAFSIKYDLHAKRD